MSESTEASSSPCRRRWGRPSLRFGASR